MNEQPTTSASSGLAGGSGNREKLFKILGEEEGKKMRSQLNPMWVEWLMGYPLDWLDGVSGPKNPRKFRVSPLESKKESTS